jgi:ankyrin repeat protein
MKRKQFLRQLSITGLAAGSLPFMAGANPWQNDPQLDKELVQNFVGAGHRDMDKVKSLLEEHPTLLNSAHDWKYGDFETCLGAASHVGFKELAQYLIDAGAQANIFTACLFGKMAVVKPMLEAFPTLIQAKGPHGYTLLHHAQKGGDEALEVKAYLESLGAKETRIDLY